MRSAEVIAARAVAGDGTSAHGKRMKNGWKSSAPWVYSIDPERIILEEAASNQTK
jgi:hypothetical protein